MPRARKDNTVTPKKPVVEPERIREVLKEGPQSNRELREKLGLSPEKYDPRLDRKLQQLRKDGGIHIVGARWALNTVVQCPHCRGRGWVETKAKGDSAPA